MKNITSWAKADSTRYDINTASAARRRAMSDRVRDTTSAYLNTIQPRDVLAARNRYRQQSSPSSQSGSHDYADMAEANSGDEDELSDEVESANGDHPREEDELARGGDTEAVNLDGMADDDDENVADPSQKFGKESNGRDQDIGEGSKASADVSVHDTMERGLCPPLPRDLSPPLQAKISKLSTLSSTMMTQLMMGFRTRLWYQNSQRRLHILSLKCYIARTRYPPT
jgi:hypothetical protein